MGIRTKIKQKIARTLNVKFDKTTGFFKHKMLGKNIFIRHPNHYPDEKWLKWKNDNIFYYYYLPKNNDTVVDLGTGYGEEAVYLHSKSPNITFYGIEIQPVIFECLANTLHGLSAKFSATSTAISNQKNILLRSQASYVDSGEEKNGYINIPCIPWNEYIKANNITNIDLLRMNVEGAEKDILSSITDFSIIKRLNISCHDFRANRGEGEHYRSKEQVLKILKENNYIIKTYNFGQDWSDDWIYAEQKNTI